MGTDTNKIIQDREIRRKQELQATLARLMATENISVDFVNDVLIQNSVAPIAAFDTENRKLFLPDWGDISYDVSAMLVTHEIGHALFSQNDLSEIKKEAEDKPGFFNVWNLVEDARIDKLMQKRYPGTLKAYHYGTQELFDMPFISDKIDENNLSILDKINLFFKLSGRPFKNTKIEFTEEQQKYLLLVDSCKTQQDAIEVARILYEFAKEEAQKHPDKYPPQPFSVPASKGNCDNGDKEIELMSKLQKALSDYFSKTGSKKLKNKIYVEITKNFNVKDYVVPYERILSDFQEFYQNLSTLRIKASESLRKFRAENKSSVGLLAQLFEQKKRAIQLLKAKTASTGKLDVNKLYSYRYNEDVFFKSTEVPTGKNHGLLMLLDLSASMSPNMKGAIEQLLVLVLFCKQVGIPFEVYGFTDNHYSAASLPKSTYIQYTPDLKNEGFSLRQYFTSSMKMNEFNAMLEHMMLLRDQSYMPITDKLGSTPLIEATYCAHYLFENFKNKHNLQIVNLITLTDGDATSAPSVINKVKTGKEKKILGESLVKNAEIILRDNKYQITWSSLDYNTKKTSDFFLKTLKERFDCNVIGFYITHEIEGISEEYNEQKFNADGIIKITNEAYDAFFLIKGGKSLEIENKKIDGIAKSEIESSLREFYRNIKNSRKLLNTFIDLIS